MSGWAAGAVVAGAVIGGVASNMAASKQASAAKDAANISAASARDATQLQGMMYDQTRSDQQPWREAGASSLNKLQQLMGTGYGSESVKKNQLTLNDLIDRSGDSWQANAELAKFSPEYRKAYEKYMNDTLVQWGVHPAESLGSVYKDDLLKGDMQSIVDAYNKKNLAEYEAGKTAAEADPSFGSLLKSFSMADYQADPGYAFRVSEGQKALERSAAARGGLYSGRAAKDLTRFGQDQGSQEYQNAFNRYQSNQNNQFNRLASIAGVGQTANNALSTAGTNYANSVGNIGMTNAANQGNAALASGNARASGYMGIASALGNVNWGSLGGSSSTGSSGGLTADQSAAYAQSNPNGYSW